VFNCACNLIEEHGLILLFEIVYEHSQCKTLMCLGHHNVILKNLRAFQRGAKPTLCLKTKKWSKKVQIPSKSVELRSVNVFHNQSYCLFLYGISLPILGHLDPRGFEFKRFKREKKSRSWLKMKERSQKMQIVGRAKSSGSSLDMYICIHVRDKGIYSRGI
jgi:hypothetical protein